MITDSPDIAIRFEPSRDFALIKSILTHPAVWPYISDDFTPPPEEWQPTEHDSVTHLLIYDRDELLGCYVLAAHNGVCWEIHTAILPHARGIKAFRAARELIPWMWQHTSCRRLITNVPVYNRPAARYAALSGLKEFGVNRASFQKGGKLHDQIMFGISRPQSKAGKADS